MSAYRSLSDFFVRSDEATLETCAREAIHRSGQVQNACGLLIVCNETGRIVGASEGAISFFYAAPGGCLGSNLRDLDANLAKLVGMATDDANMHEVLECSFEKDGTEYDVVTHQQGQHRLIEFVPNLFASPQIARAKMRHCSKSCARILNAASMDEAFQIAADASRKITGFSRVNIYRFLPDWSGEVLAESLDNAAMQSYLGLHFPASDIPAQAREIMRLVPYRAIGSVADNNHDIIMEEGQEQFDLTWSVTRSVSKMHTQYLRNMGVEATFNASLMLRGKLWGLITAHNTAPGFVPFDNWALLQEIGTALMLKQDQVERLESAAKIRNLRSIENLFASALRKNHDVEDVIKTLIPNLQEFLKADGFAFQYGPNLHVCGATPPDGFIRDLITWAQSNHNETDQYQTTALHRDWEPGAAHIETACGILIQPIVVHRVCQLIWFRGPVARKVKWAGRPTKVELDGRLTPRGSFDLWVQEHNDEAISWQESDLNSAREVFTEFLDILAAQLLLKEENAYLREFAASAVHDIKAPLRGISFALDMMSEENFDEKIVKETHSIAQGSANRLMDLSSGLLELATISDTSEQFEQTSIGAIIDDACSMLSHEIEAADVTITNRIDKTIYGNGRLLLRLFLNLIGNAVKYRSDDRAMHLLIEVTEDTDERLEIALTDTGMGIPIKHAQEIFKPLARLHSHDEIQGTGLGLTICTRILEAHGGGIHLDETYQDGARFIIRLPASEVASSTAKRRLGSVT
ncbi:MAG: GAF domain-containing protein [Silicimonas sp.]|nr:GAF domain-containing protein [Silicimonas sp.]